MSTSSSLSAISSSQVTGMISSVSPGQGIQQSSLTRSPFMTSILPVSYITTQPGMNETQKTLSSRGMASRLTQTPFVFHVSHSLNHLQNTSDFTPRETDSSEATKLSKIVPSTTVKVSVTESWNKHQPTGTGHGDLISKLLRGIIFNEYGFFLTGQLANVTS